MTPTPAEGPIATPGAEIPAARPPFDLSQRDARVAEMLRDAPPSSRGILARAFAGESSPREAIRAMCLACVGYQREEITNCTGWSCPLWRFRPYQAE